MRAAIFRQGDFVVDTIPDPVLAEGQVLVRTRSCGICGSDLHAAKYTDAFVDVAKRSGGRFAMVKDRDIVFGHEFVGEVVANGPGTEGRYAPGTLVTSMPLTIAGQRVEGVGYNPDVPGAFAEYLPLAERMLLPLPAGMDPDHAALVEPIAVGVHAVAFARTTPDDVALVIGCGPIGLAVIAALKLQGIGPVIARISPRRGGRWRGAWAPTSSSIPPPTSPYAALEAAVTPAGFDASRYAAAARPVAAAAAGGGLRMRRHARRHGADLRPGACRRPHRHRRRLHGTRPLRALLRHPQAAQRAIRAGLHGRRNSPRRSAISPPGGSTWRR